MRTIVFSDSHLTAKFDPAKFLYLQKIIEPASRVIIVGDFWDGYMTSFTDLLNSGWAKLFALLKSKDTLYVCGNHDAAALNDPRTHQFAKSCTEVLELVIDGINYHFEHGHRIVKTLDGKFPWLFQRSWIASAAAKLEEIAARIFGFKFFLIHKPMNARIKRWQRKHLRPDQVLVCGHSHWPELDEPKNFINSGFIRHHFAHHLVIEDGRTKLIRQRY